MPPRMSGEGDGGGSGGGSGDPMTGSGSLSGTFHLPASSQAGVAQIHGHGVAASSVLHAMQAGYSTHGSHPSNTSNWQMAALEARPDAQDDLHPAGRPAHALIGSSSRIAALRRARALQRILARLLRDGAAAAGVAPPAGGHHARNGRAGAIAVPSPSPI
uniref:Uncharacterized protein n=1 Tax=Haptolina brevifila TaxID=156173 RepID=A0A7S2MFJ2_9EUKA